MFERRFLPVVVVVLAGLLVAVTGAWVTGLSRSERSPAAAAPAGPATQGEIIEWKLVTTWPKNFPGLGSGPENFAKYVNEMTGGRLRVKVYGAGEVVPPFEVFDAVSQGVAQAGHGASYYWKGKIPASVFFTAVPFGMTAQEMNAWLHYGGGLELWRELYAPFGVVPFAGGSSGVQMAGWFNREINTVADLDGLKMRIPGLAGEVFNGVGGTAVRIAGGEIYTAMQTGVIDAVEWVGPYNDRTLGLDQVAEYYYYPGWHEPGALLEIIVNEAALRALSPELQAIVTYAARAANQDMLDEFTARNNESLRAMTDAGTATLRKLPDEVLEAIYAESLIALDNLVADDPLAQRIRDSYDRFGKQVRAYHEISERAYLNARAGVMSEP